MLGQMSVLGRTYPITKAELRLRPEGETWLMHLGVHASDGGFGIWGLDLTRLEDPDDLDGKRIHIRWESGEAFEDDTLGTDNIGVDDVTDLNYLQAGDQTYGYREIRVGFARLADRQYRVEVHLTLMTDDEDSAADIAATADVTVVAEEEKPSGDVC